MKPDFNDAIDLFKLLSIIAADNPSAYLAALDKYDQIYGP